MKMIKFVTGGISLSAAAILLTGCMIDDVYDENTQLTGSNTQWWQVRDDNGVTGAAYGMPEHQPFLSYQKDMGSVKAHERRTKGAHHWNYYRPGDQPEDTMGEAEDMEGFHPRQKYYGMMHKDVEPISDPNMSHSEEYESSWMGKYSTDDRPGFYHRNAE